jgi:acyl-CoA synthetase (AMP-forming)/AMP-acid ligase II
VFQDLLAAAVDGGSATAVHDVASAEEPISRERLARDVEAVSQTVAAWLAEARTDRPCIWVALGGGYRFVAGALGSLCCGSAALVEEQGPESAFDALAAACPPALVLCARPEGDAARWARSRWVPVEVLDRSPERSPVGARRLPPAEEPRLFLFTSGTTGPVMAVGIGPAQLSAAVSGVAAGVGLGTDDVSLSIAPLTHTLGFITSVLAALTSGGSAAIADLLRPRDVVRTLSAARPTWCPGSPAAHHLMLQLVRQTGAAWPGLRLLRSASSPLPEAIRTEVESHFGVPMINAYAMTEAPGEIAGQPVSERRPGTVGRPSLCEVELRPVGDGVDRVEGAELWVRGPNVVETPARDAQGWLRTGDVGVLEDGHLRLTGRTSDVINSGGLKVWPPEVEAAALEHPAVGLAVAFPVPHPALGEKIGLAVVPRSGCSVERATVRNLLMTRLPREKWPATIVVCDQLPRGARGKVQRRNLSRLLHLEES